MAIFSLPSCLLGVVIAVYLPEKIWSSPTCFLDAVSINQNDQTLMMQGIYGLGGGSRTSVVLTKSSGGHPVILTCLKDL